MYLNKFLSSSIGRKQIVATTGLILIIFLIGHLAGNLFIFAGPSAYNSYAKKLAGLRPGLYVVEFGLLIVFLLHMYFTYLLVLENIQARGGAMRYKMQRPVGNRALATRLMPYTGTFLLIFVIVHLLDFTFRSHEGVASTVNGLGLGLYGVVYNAFLNPWHSAFYIVAMGCLGFHLSHGIQSFLQTFGLLSVGENPGIKKLSNFLGIAFALAYSLIPLYIYICKP